MPQSVLEISSPSSNLPQCPTNPQLMPFNVSYSGPAPISTFFRVREKDDMRLIASSSSNVNEEHVNAEPHQSLKKRLTSAFRGRQLVGTDISLPSGYVGLILRSETQPRLPPKQHPSSISGRSTRSARNTRGSRQSKPIEVDEVDEASMDVDADLLKGDEDESGNTKVLEPIQTFDTIRVWNADVSVDEGKDEYIRSLREWTALAASVHQMEDI